MIAHLRGAVLSKTDGAVVVEAGGVGYEVLVTAADAERLAVGQPVGLFICESFGMYGGGVTLYGFLSAAEKAMFLTFKEHVPSTGAKKALEHLEKAAKSLPDFRRAILEKDARILTGVFGFSKKTADRLIDALKEKLADAGAPGEPRLVKAGAPAAPSSAMGQALSALAALGYKPAEARAALQAVAEENPGPLEVERLLRSALRRL